MDEIYLIGAGLSFGICLAVFAFVAACEAANDSHSNWVETLGVGTCISLGISLLWFVALTVLVIFIIFYIPIKYLRKEK